MYYSTLSLINVSHFIVLSCPIVYIQVWWWKEDRYGGKRIWSQWRQCIDEYFATNQRPRGPFHFAGQCPLSLSVYLGMHCTRTPFDQWTVSNYIQRLNQWSRWQITDPQEASSERLFEHCTIECNPDSKEAVVMIFLDPVGHDLSEEQRTQIETCLEGRKLRTIEQLTPRHKGFMTPDQFNIFNRELDQFLDAISTKVPCREPLVIATTGPIQAAFLLGTKGSVSPGVRSITLLDFVNGKYQESFQLP